MNFGRIYVELAEPISLKQYVNSYTHDIKLRTKEPVYKQASIALNKEDSFKEDFPKETVDPFGNFYSFSYFVCRYRYDL